MITDCTSARTDAAGQYLLQTASKFLSSSKMVCTLSLCPPSFLPPTCTMPCHVNKHWPPRPSMFHLPNPLHSAAPHLYYHPRRSSAISICSTHCTEHTTFQDKPACEILSTTCIEMTPHDQTRLQFRHGWNSALANRTGRCSQTTMCRLVYNASSICSTSYTLRMHIPVKPECVYFSSPCRATTLTPISLIYPLSLLGFAHAPVLRVHSGGVCALRFEPHTHLYAQLQPLTPVVTYRLTDLVPTLIRRLTAMFRVFSWWTELHTFAGPSPQNLRIMTPYLTLSSSFRLIPQSNFDHCVSTPN